MIISRLDFKTLEEFGLSRKISNKLYKSNIKTVQELVELTELELINIPSIGSVSIKSIKAVFKEKGLKLFFENGLSPIEELELSLRIYNSLSRNGINTIENLKKRTKEELLNVKGLGVKSVEKIIDRLSCL